jgi:type I restriction enzyme M protein
MSQNNNEIEKKLWAAADQLRANSELSAQEYSVPVLGLIFLRYADYKFTQAEEEIKKRPSTDSRRKISKADYRAKGIMSLPDNARYSYLLNLPESRNIGKAVNDAMKAIEADNEDLKGVLPQTYTRFENNVLVALLKLFSNIPMDIEGDVFGKIYEYFLGKFAMSEGKKGGEFFTPTSIVKLIVDVIEPFHGRIYDPCLRLRRHVCAERKVY